MTKRPKMETCIIGTGDLEQLQADGRITSNEADAVRMFSEWLTKSGPVDGPLTVEQRQFRRDCLADPGWCEYLGVDALPITVAPRKKASGV